MKRTLAATHLLLISPAVLFLGAVIVQRLRPLQEDVDAVDTATRFTAFGVDFRLYLVAAGFERQGSSCQPTAESACPAPPCGGEDIRRCNDRDSSSHRRNCRPAHAGKLKVLSVTALGCPILSRSLRKGGGTNSNSKP
jgi:hypothetical protein